MVPTRVDPAHRRVLRCLTREYRRFGWRVRVWATGEPFPKFLPEDLVHIHYFSRGLSRFPRIPVGCRVVLTHQGASASLIENTRSFKLMADRADHVVAVSRAGMRELESAFPDLKKKLGFIHNGGERIQAATPKRYRPYLLTVGRIASYKGLDIMAMAFAGLAEKRPDLDWIVCGPDQMGRRFHEFVRQLGLETRVYLPGSVSERKVASLLVGCEAFVLPSRAEGSPMALLEALAVGKPVIAARAGGIPEIVTHGRNGLLFKSGDPDSLKRAVKKLGKFKKRRSSLDFSWRRSAKAYRNFFGEL